MKSEDQLRAELDGQSCHGDGEQHCCCGIQCVLEEEEKKDE